jgi:ABC-type nitrate/sulfonate/bicarbonate transport system ATPase subunit
MPLASSTIRTVAPAPAYTRGDVLMAIDHVTLKYGDRVILRDVCAEIRDVVRPPEHDATGQIVCFLGPSGIGKTQLCRVIAGLQRPTSGGVRLFQAVSGTPICYRDPPAGMVGMVPQNYPLFEFATVRENLVIAGGARHVDKAEGKAHDLLAALDLEQYAGFYPKALSGGTRQRVAIARQLLCAGTFIVMDEPFSGLDPLMKRKTAMLLRKVANLNERNTIIIVTHDIVEGCSIADTVWSMGREAGKDGATLVRVDDLAALGLAWRDDPSGDRDFIEFVGELRAHFKTLDNPTASN